MMRYNLEIAFHEFDRKVGLVFAEDLEISDIIEIMKQFQLNPCYRITIMKRFERKGDSNNGNAE